MRKLIVTQVRSTIGQSERQHRIMRGLGLGKIGRTVERLDTLPIRGMITKVQHLVKVSIQEA